MDAIRSTLRKLLREDGGATAIEYGLIIALISVAAIGGFSAMGGGNGGMWTRVESDVSNSLKR